MFTWEAEVSGDLGWSTELLAEELELLTGEEVEEEGERVGVAVELLLELELCFGFCRTRFNQPREFKRLR